jgi:hypothetical protein
LRRSFKRRIIALFFCGLLLLFVLEGISRLEWSFRSDTSFFSPNVSFYYPELPQRQGAKGAGNDGILQVLLLGGSVLHPDWGNIPEALEEKLSLACNRKVRILNLAMPGHTTLDSVHKHRRLEGRRFDLIMCYHGINELRLNNCPGDMFRRDYSHYSWYRVINFFEGNPGVPDLAFLFSLGYRMVRLHEKLGSPPRYIPRDRPSEAMMEHGGDIKTASPFKDNMERIHRMARNAGAPLVLMTFAFHLPPDYSLEAFEARSLDYCLHSCPVEIWGRPADISRGIKVHNDIIRGLAAGSEGVVFVDQNARLPGGARYFNDVCHLTQEGGVLFAYNIVNALEERAEWNRSGGESGVHVGRTGDRRAVKEGV